MTFMTQVIAIQASVQKRLEALEAAPMDDEFRRFCFRAALEQRVLRMAAVVDAVEGVSSETAGEPCDTCSQCEDRARSIICAARVDGIDCGFDFLLKQRFICPNCPSLGGHHPQGHCKVCPEQD